MLCALLLPVSGNETTVTTREADIFDALVMLKDMTGMIAPLPLDIYDIDKNGKINIFDVLEILKGLIRVREPVMMPLRPGATWKEVPIPTEKTWASGYMSPLDLRYDVAGYDFVYDKNYQFTTYFFKGTIVGLKEYEVSWEDEYGKSGPYNYSMIEVKVNKEYHGKSPVKGDTVRISVARSLAVIVSGAPKFVEGGEYVFLTRVLDEKYVEYGKKFAPTYKAETEKYADLNFNSASAYALFPIEHKHVALNRGYFIKDSDMTKKVKSPEAFKNSQLIEYRDLESGLYTVFGLDDFEPAFLNLIEQVKKMYG